MSVKSHVRFINIEVERHDGQPKSTVTLKEATLSLKEKPTPGFAYVNQLQFATCTTEAGLKGYYFNGSFESEVSNKERERGIFERMVAPTIETHDSSAPLSEEMTSLLSRTPFHEGIAQIVASSPDVERRSISVLTYVPDVKEGKAVGFVRQMLETNFQTGLNPGSLAVLIPSYFCDKHFYATDIDPHTGWPAQCPEEVTSEHDGRVIRGHGSIGAAVEGTIPVLLDSLIPVPSDLQEWINKDLDRRHIVLTQVEPLGCVFQAWGKELQKVNEGGNPPDSVVIWGDGTNALLIVMFVSVFAPDAKIIVIGKSDKKLESIRQVSPENITIVKTDGGSVLEKAQDTLKEKTGNAKADVVLPTIDISEDKVAGLVKDGGLIIWWAASVSEEKVKAGEIESNKNSYHEIFSNGSAPRVEFSAVELMRYFALNKPEVLDGLIDYPGIHYLEMEEAAPAIEEWLNKLGRYTVNEEGKYDPTGKGMSVKFVVHLK